MIDPERINSEAEFFKETEEDDSFEARLIYKMMDEIYNSGKYAAMSVPENVTNQVRNFEAVRFVASDSFGSIRLFELIPHETIEHLETMERLLQSNIDSIDVSVDLSDDVVRAVPFALEEEDVHVLGAFQLGAQLKDEKRTIDIIYPVVFAEMTGSLRMGADLSVYFLKMAKRNIDDKQRGEMA